MHVSGFRTSPFIPVSMHVDLLGEGLSYCSVLKKAVLLHKIIEPWKNIIHPHPRATILKQILGRKLLKLYPSVFGWRRMDPGPHGKRRQTSPVIYRSRLHTNWDHVTSIYRHLNSRVMPGITMREWTRDSFSCSIVIGWGMVQYCQEWVGHKKKKSSQTLQFCENTRSLGHICMMKGKR